MTLIDDASDVNVFPNNYLKYLFVNFLSTFSLILMPIYDLNVILFFLVHMMDEISVDAPYQVSEKVLLLF